MDQIPAKASLNGRGLGRPFSLIIDNQNIDPGDEFEVLDPITRSVVHYAPAATQVEAIKAVESAEAAFESWRDSTPLEKRTIFNKAIEILKSREDELVNAMVRETGAKPSWAAFNIKLAIQFVMEGAGMVTQVKGELLQSNDKGKYCDLVHLTSYLTRFRDNGHGVQRAMRSCARDSTLECTDSEPLLKYRNEFEKLRPLSDTGDQSVHDSSRLWQHSSAKGVRV